MIVYLSGNTVYLDAGREQGIQAGQEVVVQRDSVEIVLTVANVSSHRASCPRPEGNGDLRVGDLVRFTPIIVSEAGQAGVAKLGGSPRTEGWLRRNGIRGSVDLRYLSLQDQTGNGERYSQPALNLRVSGRDVGGRGIEFSADVRTRRTYRTRTDGEKTGESRNRVYRLNAGYAIDPRIVLLGGRQTSPDLAAVSIFDGVLAEFRSGRWKAGAFAGTQPDPEDYGYSTEILELGAFGRLSQPSEASSRWSGTAGIVSSRVAGELNRDYLFLRGQWNDSHWSAYANQEVDFNHGWKTAAGESAISPTSTALSLQARLLKDLLFRAGFDNRRNIRVARDRETPETEFDDAYRLGWSLDGDWRAPRRVQIGLGYRTYDGASAGRSESVTGRLRLTRLSPWGLELGARGTWYVSPGLEGRLHSVSLSGNVASKHRLEGHAGRRDEDRKSQGQGDIRTWWYGADVDLHAAGAWFLLFSFESVRGDVERNDEIYTSLSYRF